MTEQVYKDMLEVMKSRRGPYASMDIPEFYELVEVLFTPQEAEVNNALKPKPATAGDIAKEMGRNEDEIAGILEAMADKGLCKTFMLDGRRCYQGVPFIPGIFEYQFMAGQTSKRHKKIAELIHAYEQAYETVAGKTKMTFPTSRVIVVDKAIDAGNTIHTYDQVASYIEKYDTIAIVTCYCRHAAQLRGEDVHGMPSDVCMWFDTMAEYSIERLGARQLSKNEAMDVLNRSEEAGLMHMSRNTTDDIEFICNCDRWHCGTVQRVLKQPKPALFFNSGFEPRFDPDLCVACETCIERCPPEALTLGDDEVPEVDLDRCFGCAVCATGCPSEAIVMEAKPDFPVPPKDTRELVTALKASIAK
jgi:Pyruvate/2-oxoacid:ferredoxin oxidoreductase delta subunit